MMTNVWYLNKIGENHFEQYFFIADLKLSDLEIKERIKNEKFIGFKNVDQDFMEDILHCIDTDFYFDVTRNKNYAYVSILSPG